MCDTQNNEPIKKTEEQQMSFVKIVLIVHLLLVFFRFIVPRPQEMQMNEKPTQSFFFDKFYCDRQTVAKNCMFVSFIVFLVEDAHTRELK